MSLNFLVYNERQAHASDIFSLAKSSNAIISTSSDGSIKYWDLKTNDCIHSLEHALPSGGHSIAASGDACLVGVSFSGTLVDFAPGSESVNNLPVQGTTIAESSKDSKRVNWCVALSPDGATIATCTSDGTLQVYDAASKSLVAAIETRGQFGMCIDYAPNNRSIATGHADGGVYTFDTESGKLKHSIHSSSSSSSSPSTFTTKTASMRSVKFSPNSEILASAGDSGTIALHDVRTGEQIADITAHESCSITALDWNASGELLATAASDGRIKIWHVGRKECVGTFTESRGHKVWCLVWCKMGPSNVEGFIVGGSETVLRFYLPTST